MDTRQPKTCPCPKCNRTLVQSGEMTIDDGHGNTVTTPVFQCDECLVIGEMFGDKMELPLTFVLGADGQPCDPAAPDGRLRF